MARMCDSIAATRSGANPFATILRSSAWASPSEKNIIGSSVLASSTPADENVSESRSTLVTSRYRLISQNPRSALW